MICVGVSIEDHQRPFFSFTSYRIYHVWQNAVDQPCVTDDFGTGWRVFYDEHRGLWINGGAEFVEVLE